MLAVLTKLLPAINGLVGVAGVLALIAWVADNSSRSVCFGYDQLAIFAGLIVALLEFNRRTPTN